MKILFIAPNYLPHIGGVEKHIEMLTKELLKDGHYITILVLKHNNYYKDYERQGNLEIIRLNKSNFKFGNRLNIFKYMILNFFNLLKYDIIHFHDYSTFWSYGLPVWLPLKLMNKKMFVTFHGWEGDFPPKKSVILKRKVVEKLTNGNICIGHFIEKWYGTKANIISYGGVEKTNKNIETFEKKFFLFVGRLEVDTGITYYLKAWEKFSKNKDYKLIICGDGSLREKLEKYVKQNSIPNVIFKGFISNVDNYLKDAKIVLTSGYLGILESFSLRKNVIAIYDNKLKRDYLEMMPNSEKIMWIVDNDIENIVKVFEKVLKNNNKKEMAYKFAIENSWEKVKKDYYKLWGI